jgi:hypothetical protein
MEESQIIGRVAAGISGGLVSDDFLCLAFRVILTFTKEDLEPSKHWD